MKKLIEHIKEIINLLNKIDANIEKLAKGTGKSSYYKEETPYKPYKITLPEKTAPYNNYSVKHVSQAEWEALDELYYCLVDSAHHPDHYEHVMREIAVKWPELSHKLSKLVRSRQQKDYLKNYRQKFLEQKNSQLS